MSIDNTPTSNRGLLPAGLGLLLVLSALSGVPSSSGAVSVDADTEPAGDVPVSVQEGENNTTNVTISVVQAMESAQNETNGTAIGAELTREGNVTDLERPTRVYQVDVLAANGTQFIVNVNASEGSVERIQKPDNDTGFFEGLFEDEGETVQNRDVNVTDIRSGVEAVQLVLNETDRNRTVSKVELTSQNETLVYQVHAVTEEGARPSILVAAKPSEGGVLTTETEGGHSEERLG